jgi:hypothetical protein
VSTGLDCQFIEYEPGKWKYKLESSFYREQYETYGPFMSFTQAEKHLEDNHANPGGYGITTHATEHKHEFVKGETSVPVGVEFSIRIQSLGPTPTMEQILARLVELGADELKTRSRVRQYTAYQEAVVCASCNEVKS